MMRRSIHEVLREVPAGADAAYLAGGSDGGRPPTLTLEAQLDAAFARGFEEGRLAAQQEADTMLAESAARQAQLIEAEAAKWRDVLVGQALERLQSQLAAFQAQTSGEAARVLGRILQGAETERAIGGLVRDLMSILEQDGISQFVVSGPAKLLERFRAQLEAHCEAGGRALPSFTAHESDSVDLCVAVDSAMLETRLCQWAARVREVMAP